MLEIVNIRKEFGGQTVLANLNLRIEDGEFFSLLGPSFLTRLVTQMFFPGDPLHAFDPIFHGVPEHVRHRVVAAFDLDATVPDWSLAFRFDLVLRGREATPSC